MAQFEGANLIVFLAEPGANGQPNLAAARRLVFTRAGAAKPDLPDAQISELLMRNAWCAFSSNERIVFYSNGMVSRTGEQGRWKIGNGMLYLSPDGVNWQPQPLQVTQSSSGHPILKSGGKDYLVCR
jgi:hypothetical protein